MSLYIFRPHHKTLLPSLVDSLAHLLLLPLKIQPYGPKETHVCLFLSRVSILSCDTDMGILSVRPSVTFWYWMKTA